MDILVIYYDNNENNNKNGINWNKTVLTYQQLQTTTAISKLTTTTPTQKPTRTPYNGCIKTVIGNLLKIQTNATTSITIRTNAVLTALMNQLKWFI